MKSTPTAITLNIDIIQEPPNTYISFLTLVFWPFYPAFCSFYIKIAHNACWIKSSLVPLLYL